MKCSRTLHCILIAFALLHPSAFAQEEAVVDLDRDAPVTASSSDEHEAKKHDATHKKIDESIDSNVVPTPDETLEAKNKVDANENPNESVVDEKPAKTSHVPLQSGPLIDLLGHQLLSLEMIDETSAQLKPHYTNEVLNKAKVIGIYFSADWCGPCRQFTPELLSFYNKMNARKGKKGDFQIVWVSRCRDMNAYGQYFAQMPGWLALPPEEAMGKRGEMLSNKYKVKGIPSLVLIDDLGDTITKDARNKIPTDKAGIGFPWRNPVSNVYVTLVPKSIRLLISNQIRTIKDKMIQRVRGLFVKAKSQQ